MEQSGLESPETKEISVLNITELEKDPSGNPVYFAEYDERVLSPENREIVNNHVEQKPWKSDMYLHIDKEEIVLNKEKSDFQGTKVLFDDQGTPQIFLFSKEIDEFLRTGKDSLTKLDNREGWITKLRELAESIQRGNLSKKHITIGMFDLDDLKKANDASEDKHSGGDKCLQKMAQHLKDNTRTIDVVARIGGDEFSFYGVNGTNSVKNLKEKFDTSKDRAISFSAGLVDVDTEKLLERIGSNLDDKYRTDLVYAQLEEAVKKADQIMYEAKKESKTLPLDEEGRKPSLVFTEKSITNASL